MSARSASASRTRTSRTSRRCATPSTTSAPGSRPELTLSPALEALAGRIGHWFGDVSLLEQALVHRSCLADEPETEPNERLEFLGDAVLGLVVTDEVFRSYPSLAEGELAKIRAAVVSATPLAELGAELGIGPALVLGRGEEWSGGREKPSILANALEAVIGAVYLDGGMEAARALVLRLVGERIADAAEGPGGLDFKTRLQELAARDHDTLPEYDLVDEGPDHAKRFFARVRVGEETYGPGEGRSKKQAEQAAARAAWEALRDA